ncbi:hypothetical protein H8S45_07880 [Agathobaculum sp. NSJ-28]|uniref:Uncharacterized protein n=1 Tax=Agathobaculum faecis TaxID=2763013 RepID=A0A923LWV9_9FIRM|nr:MULTISPECIES: hypothetical protein [Butyricicoccaceae]MBC5725377.1 hypothetical protein [Agathobaculum faecis]MBS6881847.1 hypothetical protein [Clostridiaceae bacterium]WOC76193.1 hypothetical protein RX717_04185 [Intestinibacillus sp. NTUH-41-i26]
MRTKIIIGLVILVFIFSGYWLLSPVEYQVPPEYDCLHISVSGAPAFEISDPDTVESLVEAINSTTYRKRMQRITDAPENLAAVIQLVDRDTNTSVVDVIVLSTYEGNHSFGISDGDKDLIAVSPDLLETCIDSLIDRVQ